MWTRPTKSDPGGEGGRGAGPFVGPSGTRLGGRSAAAAGPVVAAGAGRKEPFIAEVLAATDDEKLADLLAETPARRARAGEAAGEVPQAGRRQGGPLPGLQAREVHGREGRHRGGGGRLPAVLAGGVRERRQRPVGDRRSATLRRYRERVGRAQNGEDDDGEATPTGRERQHTGGVLTQTPDQRHVVLGRQAEPPPACVRRGQDATPYDPATDAYDVPAFNQPIETTKATAIYNMHVYWSKKPHQAIRQYIRHYTKPGDIVLDPFCGSGGTAVSALLDGRKAIAIDRSPAATFIAKNHCTPVDPDELRSAFQKVKQAIQAEIDWLYETRCDRCGGKAMTGYTVYSQVFQCPRCLSKIPLYDCGSEESQTAAGKAKDRECLPDVPGQRLHGGDPVSEREVRVHPGEGGLPLRGRVQADSGRARAQRLISREAFVLREIRSRQDSGRSSPKRSHTGIHASRHDERRGRYRAVGR